MNMEYITAALSLAFVLALIFLMGWVMRKLGLTSLGTLGSKGENSQLEVIESRMIDGRNRLVLARCGRKYYLLGSGQDGLRKIDDVNDQDLTLNDICAPNDQAENDL